MNIAPVSFQGRIVASYKDEYGSPVKNVIETTKAQDSRLLRYLDVQEMFGPQRLTEEEGKQIRGAFNYITEKTNIPVPKEKITQAYIVHCATRNDEPKISVCYENCNSDNPDVQTIEFIPDENVLNNFAQKTEKVLDFCS